MGRSSLDDPDAVVVPAQHGGSSLACLRSLGRRGVRTIGVAPSRDAAALHSRYCDESVVVPAPEADLAGYGDALLALAERPDVVTVVPLYEPDAYVLAKRRDEFAEHVATPWPEFEALRAVQDRHRLFEVAADAGVAIPETGLLDDWHADGWSASDGPAAADGRPADPDGRVVVKPRYTLVVEDGRVRYPDVTVLEPGEEPEFERLVAEMGHVPLVQAYVPGDFECGFFALCDRGEPVATFQHRRVRSYTYAGGASVFRRSYRDPALAGEGRSLLAALDWHGPAMVECKRDPRDGSYRLVEVNPRFWGSLPLAVAAGVDFPWRYFELAAGDAGETGSPSDYEVGVGCHVLRGEASYLHSVARYEFDHRERPSLPGATWTVLASILADPRFDYLAADDPRPFLRDLRNRLAALGPG